MHLVLSILPTLVSDSWTPAGDPISRPRYVRRSSSWEELGCVEAKDRAIAAAPA